MCYENLAAFLNAFFCSHLGCHKVAIIFYLKYVLPVTTVFLFCYTMSHGQYGFPFDLLSTEGALKLVPILAFDTVYLCFEKYGTVQSVLCKHPRDNTGACLIQVNFNKFTFFGN